MLICQYIETKKEEFGAWPVCEVLTGAGVKIAPKHVTHARRSRPPSARSLRDETWTARCFSDSACFLASGCLLQVQELAFGLVGSAIP